MANKELQALERLAPKLTALRKTVRGEERKVLDRMVASVQAEVTGHSASVSASNVGSKASTKVSEVSMHSANVRQKNTGSKTAEAESRQSVGRIELDARIGVYRVTIL
jgi:hypothetical protein